MFSTTLFINTINFFIHAYNEVVSKPAKPKKVKPKREKKKPAEKRKVVNKPKPGE